MRHPLSVGRHVLTEIITADVDVSALSRLPDSAEVDLDLGTAEFGRDRSPALGS